MKRTVVCFCQTIPGHVQADVVGGGREEIVGLDPSVAEPLERKGKVKRTRLHLSKGISLA